MKKEGYKSQFAVVVKFPKTIDTAMVVIAEAVMTCLFIITGHSGREETI